MSPEVMATQQFNSVLSAPRISSVNRRHRFSVIAASSRENFSTFPSNLKPISSGSLNLPGFGWRSENAFRTVFDAFFFGKAVGEVLTERVESIVREFLSGKLQAEQEKQILKFQEEVLEKARRAKIQATREALEALGLMSTSLGVSAVEDVAETASSITGSIISTASSVTVEGIEKTASSVTDSVNSVASSVAPTAKVKDVAEMTSSVTGSVISVTSSVVPKPTIEDVAKTTSSVTDSVISIGGTAVGDVTENTSSVTHSVSSTAVEDVAETTSSVVKDVAETTSSAVKDVAETTSSVVKDVAKTAGGAVEDAAEAAHAAEDAFLGIFKRD